MEPVPSLAVYKEWMSRIRNNRHCHTCDECHPAVLGFYSYGDPEAEYSIGAAAYREITLEQLEEELKTYVVRCLNCHIKSVAAYENLLKVYCKDHTCEGVG
jgi:hypothetical protein